MFDSPATCTKNNHNDEFICCTLTNKHTNNWQSIESIKNIRPLSKRNFFSCFWIFFRLNLHKNFSFPFSILSVFQPKNKIYQTNQFMLTRNQSYKKTVVYDPLKSETYRALQESSYTDDRVREVATPVQPKVFQPNRLVPGKKPVSSFPPPDPISRHPVNSLGESTDVIHQSGSFKRLMYHVLGETDY